MAQPFQKPVVNQNGNGNGQIQQYQQQYNNGPPPVPYQQNGFHQLNGNQNAPYEKPKRPNNWIKGNGGGTKSFFGHKYETSNFNDGMVQQPLPFTDKKESDKAAYE